MLVLSRKIGEKIVIDENIIITIIEARGGKVRLAIDAPSEIPVDRFEIHERKSQNQQKGEEGPS